ncbi:hypothetical protein M409DRAFT_17450 [Zasmidium cellare ATCC 36951]|uniref:Uncharacterized protein n=1 Tax=Zasmidium cellare ATCC 36951 TaxID=1080233 RepID=A0A6A6CYQ0_ZASCE|nr:uncharacterized protein M409DRAFT_17450 [Zasmidium cellare ATCC 36951]KAF2172211.1 hypothetical protein M409DRAFT_17450 [Zasmidium cellare ATCC 36951]
MAAVLGALCISTDSIEVPHSLPPSRVGGYQGYSRPTYTHIPASIVAQMSEDYVRMGSALKSRRQSIGFGSNGRLHGKLTYTDNHGEPVKFLAMDEFEEELHHAYCTDQTVEISFHEEVDFQEIMRDWKFINDHEDNHVLLITTTQQCDKGLDATNNLQPWIVSSAQFDDTANNVTLIGDPVEFSQLPYHAQLEASSQGKLIPAKFRRDEPATSEEYKTPGDIDFNVEIAKVGIALGSAGDVLKSLQGKPPDVTIACMNCSIHGGLDFDVNIHADLNSKTKLSGGIFLKAKDVGATIRILLSVNSILKDVISTEQPVFGYVPTGLGFYFGKIIDIGPTAMLYFKVNVGGNEMPVAVETGFDLSIDPNAEFKLDFADPTKSDASDWQPKFEALDPRVSEGNYSLDLQMGPVLQFVIAGKVLGMGAEAGFDMGGGNMDFKVEQGVKSDMCSKKRSTGRPDNAQGSKKNGFNFSDHVHNQIQDRPAYLKYDMGLVNEIKAFADANFFGAKAYAGHVLKSESTQLATTCGELPQTTEFLKTNAALVLPSVSTFEATQIVGSAISAVSSVVEKVEEVATATIASGAKEVATGVIAPAATNLGDSVKNAICAHTIFC